MTEPLAPLIFQHELPHAVRHRDWLLKLASVADPFAAEAFRLEAASLSLRIKQARERADNVHA